MRLPKSKIRWTQKQIDEEKRRIKMRLDGLLEKVGPKRRLEEILSSVRELREGETPEEQLQCFIYIISALVHHDRYGGLLFSQAQKLASIALVILQIQGIEPISSNFAFLYGEVHLALSQAYRKQGLHWMSAWEQQMAGYLSGRASGAALGNRQLGTGIRALRLGHGSLAVDALGKATSLPLPERTLARAQIESVRALRFAGDLESAKKQTQKYLMATNLRLEEKQELLWEALCQRLQTDFEVLPLMTAVRRGKSHHSYAYLNEAFLWSRAVKSKEWLDRFPTLRSLARDPGLSTPTKDLFYKCALVIQKSYDYDVPFPVRLRSLGKILPKVTQLIAVDQELLVWAATARWLTRSRCFSLASLALNEYQALSLRLSNGVRRDALGILSDLLEKDWFLTQGENDTEAA